MLDVALTIDHAEGQARMIYSWETAIEVFDLELPNGVLAQGMTVTVGTADGREIEGEIIRVEFVEEDHGQ